jgi:hypothetical protein
MSVKEARGDQNNDQMSKTERLPYRVRLPGFITDEDIGLGDIIKHATSTVGIRTCGDCARRAAALNRWLLFSGRRPK